jgi:hypothetical protein
MKHAESCKRCKAALLNALRDEYGEIIQQWKPGWPCQFNDLRTSGLIEGATGDSLKSVYRSLQKHRGYSKFVGWKRIPACDYYIPALNRLLEFDESQHFTSARAVIFQHYPKRMKIGFDKSEWLERCRAINRHDNHPPHRDETRAWYDTLRDILPIQFGMNSTIRIYSKHMIWCQENVELKKFVKSLKKI